MVAALPNKSLRTVRSDVGNPYSMMLKPEERFDSKSAVSRISKKSELDALRYTDVRRDIRAYMDKMADVIEQLESINTPIPSARYCSFDCFHPRCGNATHHGCSQDFP